MWGGHVVMPAETDSGAFYYHDGEELVYMLSGVLVFELEARALHATAGRHPILPQ